MVSWSLHTTNWCTYKAPRNINKSNCNSRSQTQVRIHHVGGLQRLWTGWIVLVHDTNSAFQTGPSQPSCSATLHLPPHSITGPGCKPGIALTLHRSMQGFQSSAASQANHSKDRKPSAFVLAYHLTSMAFISTGSTGVLTGHKIQQTWKKKSEFSLFSLR